jgi:hypothetical protein
MGLERRMKMKKVQLFDKNTLLVYLINELSAKQTWEVTTILDDDGCWTGQVLIKELGSEEPKDIDDYYKKIAERC